ncbi:hypothetical protein LBMAG53_24260 [Planctomycetota bacterium]|nr:hypothetical protein LBMAG53_24260 [Planctomycetota bacterium]
MRHFIALCCLVAFAALAAGEATNAANATTPLTLAPELVLNLPTSWERLQPAGPRIAQYRIPGDAGTAAEFTVFSFGPQGAGDVEANLNRWLGQFAEDGRQQERSTGTARHGEYHLAQITGTFNKAVGPPMAGKTEPQPGSAMLGVVLPGPQGPLYLKLTGPKELVLAQRAALEAAIRKEGK